MRPIRAIFASGPDFFLAWLFWYTWVYPVALDGKMVPYLVSLYLLEMVAIFSLGIGLVFAAEEKPLRDRLKSVGATVGMGSIVVAGFSLTFQSWFPILSYWGLAINKLLPGLLAIQPVEEALLRSGPRLGLSIVLFFILAFVSVLIPFPELGVTESLTRFGLDGGGEWFDHPHTVMAVGGLYFFLLGLAELVGALMINGKGGDVTPHEPS